MTLPICFHRILDQVSNNLGKTDPAIACFSFNPLNLLRRESNSFDLLLLRHKTQEENTNSIQNARIHMYSIARKPPHMPLPSNEFMRSLTCDEFIQWMLDNHCYDVDVETGKVWSHKTQQWLTLTKTQFGYFCVALIFNRKVRRQVKVHRMIAIKLYGVEAAKGKQVAHLDGSKTNNSVQNLQLMTPAEHVKYDGTHKNLQPGKRKTDWKPCVRCGDPNGRSDANTTPDRITGKRFGIDGVICRKCYRALQERHRRAIAKQRRQSA